VKFLSFRTVIVLVPDKSQPPDVLTSYVKTKLPEPDVTGLKKLPLTLLPDHAPPEIEGLKTSFKFTAALSGHTAVFPVKERVG
jgi:hypothetical protein